MSFERWIETANKDQAFYLSSPAWQVRTAYQAGVEAERERSAASDLLKACKVAIETWDDDSPGPGDTEKGALRRLRAAIAKAEGSDVMEGES